MYAKHLSSIITIMLMGAEFDTVQHQDIAGYIRQFRYTTNKSLSPQNSAKLNYCYTTVIKIDVPTTCSHKKDGKILWYDLPIIVRNKIRSVLARLNWIG